MRQFWFVLQALAQPRVDSILEAGRSPMGHIQGSKRGKSNLPELVNRVIRLSLNPNKHRRNDLSLKRQKDFFELFQQILDLFINRDNFSRQSDKKEYQWMTWYDL